MPTNYWTGKGYSLSPLTDVLGRNLLTFQGPGDKQPFLLSDRVAQTFDFTVAQRLTAGAMKNARMDASLSSFVKGKLGGGSDDELDHKISLELGGANTPANLWIQTGITAGASAASDTIENNLALDVVNGKISLLTAWRTLAEQKGFLLGEDSKIGTNFSISQIASQVYDIAAQWLKGEAGREAKAADATLKAQMKDDLAKIAQDPLNQPLATKIFNTQVESLSGQLSISKTEAGKVVKSYLGAYAAGKGIDPREEVSALNANIQRIIDNSTSNPNIYGIESTTILKIVAAVQALGGVAISIGVLLVIIGLFLVGPETALAAITSGGIGLLTSLLGLTTAGALGVGAIEIGAATFVLSFGVGFVVKEVYDNAYLAPTQQITALKDALAVQKGLAGFLPSAVAAPAPSPAATSSGGGTAPKLFIGQITKGQLIPVTKFTTVENDRIATLADLTQAAELNVAAWLSALPGMLSYQLKLKTAIVNDDGTETVGSTLRVQKGVTKKGKPTYKNVSNKFAVVDVLATKIGAGKVVVGELVLGAVDETVFKPTIGDLASVGNKLTNEAIAAGLHNVHSISTGNVPAGGSAQPISPASFPLGSIVNFGSGDVQVTADGFIDITTGQKVEPPLVGGGSKTGASPPNPAAATPLPPPIFTPQLDANGIDLSNFTPIGTIGSVLGSSAPFGKDGLPAYVDKTGGIYYLDAGQLIKRADAKPGVAFTAPAPTSQTTTQNQTSTSSPAPGAATGGTTSPQPLGSFSRMVTVNVGTLYVRAAPQTSAPLAGSKTLHAGDQFQATGWAVGESVQGENRWWISFRGDYVWTGGTTEKP